MFFSDNLGCRVQKKYYTQTFGLHGAMWKQNIDQVVKSAKLVISSDFSLVERCLPVQFEFEKLYRRTILHYCITLHTQEQPPELFLKDILNPYNCLLKNVNFSVKTSNE